MLACSIPLDSDFVALLSVALLFGALWPRTFNPSRKAKCTLGIAVCRFSGEF